MKDFTIIERNNLKISFNNITKNDKSFDVIEKIYKKAIDNCKKVIMKKHQVIIQK